MAYLVSAIFIDRMLVVSFITQYMYSDILWIYFCIRDDKHLDGITWLPNIPSITCSGRWFTRRRDHSHLWEGLSPHLSSNYINNNTKKKKLFTDRPTDHIVQHHDDANLLINDLVFSEFGPLPPSLAPSPPP